MDCEHEHLPLSGICSTVTPLTGPAPLLMFDFEPASLSGSSRSSCKRDGKDPGFGVCPASLIFLRLWMVTGT